MSRRQSDDGAIAVLWAIVLAVLAAPLAGLVLASYVRTATVAELQRAADQGALAGAAVVPLGDLNFAKAYLDATSGGATSGAGTPLAGYLPPGPANPLAVACAQARIALAADDGFGARYARPHAPASGDGTDPDGPVCTARYLPDSSLGAALQSCTNALAAGSGVPLPGLPNLSRTIPALVHPGVEVSLTWPVRGPLDGLLGTGQATPHKVTGAAVRRFKDLVVLPTAPLPTGATVDLNPAVSSPTASLYTTLKAAEAVLNPTLAAMGCSGILAALGDDLADLNPGTNPNPPTTADIVAGAAAAATPLLVAEIPPDPTGYLGVPFLDFVPVCLDPAGTNQGTPAGTALPAAPGTAACGAATPGAFRSTLVKS